ncbi:MAG: NosD domain-containing protein, partial [Candidatus Thorarchaeota archaeon]|nr:NosD domain-containing protein [Candidatus Thorarchaeota archaeon]
EDEGFDLWSIEGLTVSGNTITNARIGIQTSLLVNPSFENNVLADCGFFLGGNHPIIYYNFTMSGNTVNSLPIYFGMHETSGTLNTDDYGQVLLVNCSNFAITGGVMERITIPIELLHCDYIDITDLTSMYNSYGVYLYASANVTLSDSYVEGFVTSGFGSFGFSADNSYDVIIQDSAFIRCITGSSQYGVLDFGGCVDVNIINCEISYGLTGLFFADTDNITILDSEILHFDEYGIRFYQNPAPCTYIHIEQNMVYNSTRGIYGDQAGQWMIRNNTVMHNSIYGIMCGGGSGDYGNITLNTIESNGYGIRISSADYHYIYNNTLRWNDNGIYFNGISDGSLVWNNIIALSTTDNGYDDRSGNFWNVSTQGNSWDDFVIPAPYDVDGDTTDEHPTRYLPTMPIINQPLDFYYAEGSEGNEITWHPFDDALSHWELVIDGSVWVGEAWDFVDITVNVDGLDYGPHTAILTVWDVDQNTVSDTIQIIVFDDTPPTISNAPNTEAFVDGSGQTLSWTVSDLHPDTYILFVDGEEFATGTWTSGVLEVNIDGLEEGVRDLQMVISDIDGNTAVDPVDVLVIADGDNPTIDSPADITYTEGTTGNVIIWTPSDAHPDFFEVTANGSVLVSGSWGGARIVLNVDGLQPGTHNFALTVTDGSGNEVSDTVRVIVLAIVGETTPPPPLDLGPILIMVGVAGAVVVVIVVIYFIKKRGSA